MPAWLAAIVQVPNVKSVTDAPETVHTGVVVEVKATARPDEAVAEIVNGATTKLLAARAAKVIVCVPLLMTTLLVTCGAALNVAFPA